MATDRRTFLVSGAATVAGASTLSALRPRVFAAGPDGVGAGALAELKRALGDRLVAPSDTRYEALRRVRNRAFDAVRPRAIVMAKSPQDVQLAVRWAAANKVPIVPRCGGHSYIGQSTTDGLVVSVVPMRGVTVDKRAMTAEVGAGAMNVDVNVGLLQQDVALPTGSCPSVGVAGLTLGGGVGFSSGKWGLMCDNLLGVRMVLADGRLVDVDEAHMPELLWACRGGGGGHFGIVTSFRFRVHAVEPISTYALKWPWSSASQALDAWQQWAPGRTDGLFSVCTLTKGKGEPQIKSHGRFFGSAKELRRRLAPLIAAAKPIAAPAVQDTTLWKSHVLGPKCWPKPSDCHSWNHPEPGRYKQATYKVKSDYFRDPLCPTGRGRLIRWIEQGQQQAISWGGVILDAFGGAVNAVPPDATAYVHRDMRIQAEYVAHWRPNRSDKEQAANLAWMRGLYGAMRPWASGECYQNYPDVDLKRWEHRYFGRNLPRLRAVKDAVDPTGLFRGDQILAPS